jgi:hypothetical protein
VYGSAITQTDSPAKIHIEEAVMIIDPMKNPTNQPEGFLRN